MGSYLEAGKGLPSQETLRSHEESFRWPQDNSGKSGGSAELAPPPPGGQAREEGRRKGLPVWLGTPTGLADTRTCFFLEPCPADWPVHVLLCQERLPARTRGIGLRMAVCSRG